MNKLLIAGFLALGLALPAVASHRDPQVDIYLGLPHLGVHYRDYQPHRYGYQHRHFIGCGHVGWHGSTRYWPYHHSPHYRYDGRHRHNHDGGDHGRRDQHDHRRDRRDDHHDNRRDRRDQRHDNRRDRRDDRHDNRRHRDG